MKQLLAYSFKIWLTALVLTPLLSYFIWEMGNSILAYVNRNRSYNIGVFYGTDTFQFSNLGWIQLQNTPYYLLYFVVILIAINYLHGQVIQLRLIKLILTVVAVLLTSFPFVIFQIKMFDIVFNEKLDWFTSFGIFFIAGIWFYKLNLINSQKQ